MALHSSGTATKLMAQVKELPEAGFFNRLNTAGGQASSRARSAATEMPDGECSRSLIQPPIEVCSEPMKGIFPSV
ncbi:hypothetical protein D3C85_1601630 [compost metagenome]